MSSHDSTAFALCPASQEDAALASRLIFLSMEAELADYLFGGAHLPVEYRVAFPKTYPGAAGDAHTGHHRMVKELI